MLEIKPVKEEKLMLLPRRKTPELTVQTLNHGTFDLAEEGASLGTLICFYRGLHCPICANYLRELEKSVAKFEERGVHTIAISADPHARAQQMAESIDAKSLRIGYDLPLSKAREWGLFISTSRGKTSIGIEEPALFSEPGLFLVQKDQSLFFSSIQTMPFSRPHFSELLGAIDFVIDKNYPARGEYNGDL